MMGRTRAALVAALLALATALFGSVAGSSAQAAPAAQAASSGVSSYIVQLKATGTPVAQQASQVVAAAGGGRVTNVYTQVLRGFAARLSSQAAAALGRNPLVASVRPDVAVRAVGTQTNATWGLDRSDQRALPLNGTYTYPAGAGAGAHVYVIDTGLNANHAEFTGRVGTSRNFVGGFLGLFAPNPNSWSDCHGHGTHVASTAAGTTWGIAKKATVHAVRVLDCLGSGSSSAIIAGMDWVAANHQSPAVANMSLGSVGGRAPDLETAARNLVNRGVALAVAAGNDNANACNTSPAAEPSALTTGATTTTDARASFSNFGSCVDLFAPGENITAANSRNTTGSTVMSGTSMASPHVAGALALVRGASPSLSATSAMGQVVANATSGVVANAGSGSPNRLLYVPAQ